MRKRGQQTLLSTMGQRHFVRTPKLSSRQRAASGIFEQAERLGYKSAFPTPGDARAFVEAHQKRSGGGMLKSMLSLKKTEYKGMRSVYIANPTLGKTYHGVITMGAHQRLKPTQTFHTMGKRGFISHHVSVMKSGQVSVKFHKSFKAAVKSFLPRKMHGAIKAKAMHGMGSVHVKAHTARGMHGHLKRVKSYTRKARR